MVKSGDECQLTVYMSPHGNLCYDSLLRRSVVPVKFLLVSFNHTTRWLWYGLGDDARCVPRSTTPDTAQSERALVRLFNTSS